MALTTQQLDEAKQLAGTVSQSSFSPTNDSATFSKYQNYRTQLASQIQSNPLVASAGSDVGARLADVYLGIDKGDTLLPAVQGFGGPEDIQSKYGGISGLASYLVGGGVVQQTTNPETINQFGGKEGGNTTLDPTQALQGLPTDKPGGFDITEPGGGFINKSKFEAGFEQANQALGGKAGDVSGGAALVNQYSPARTNDFSSMFVQGNDFLGGLVQTFQDYINPVNQRTSLKETYDQMIKDSGVEAIDMELVDMKAVVEGTEDDLRTEITKSGGFATESQIQALTNARNKQLIKNYNRLVDTRNAKEKYLQTAIELEQADRQSADQRFESMFNMGVQIQQMQQQMQTNARNQMQWLASNIGFDGLYDSTNGDPYYMGLVEQTLGLPKGGLLSAANQAQTVKAQAEQERQLELQRAQLGLEEARVEIQLKGEQIKTEAAQRAKIYADIQNIQDSQKGTILDPNTPEGRKQLAFNKGQIDQIGNILSSGTIKTAVGPNIFSRYGAFRNILVPSAANFIGDVEQLRSQLSLDALINAKERGATFGALSDQELQILSTSGTKIGSWVTKDKSGNVTGYKVKESDFKRELDKINNFAKLDYVYRGGDPVDVGVQLINGKFYTKNSDGSVTEL